MHSLRELRRLRLIPLAAGLVLGCATDPAKHGVPAQLQSTASGAPVILEQDVELSLPWGLRVRELRKGSEWVLAGEMEEGRVYRPIDAVLQIKAGNAHEAMLVVSNGKATGLYLPVEDLFLKAKEPLPCRWENTP